MLKDILAYLKNSKWLWCILGAILLLLAAAGWYQYFAPPPQPATYMPQREAQKPAGVEKAADQAKVPMTPAQLSGAAQKIQSARTRPPDQIRQTTAARLADDVEEARKKAKADFAIVTDAGQENTSPKVALAGGTGDVQTEPAGDQTKICDDTPVTLNQYNIQAYKEKQFVAFIGARSIGAAKVHKVELPRIPLLLPKGAVGYAGPYLSVWHGGWKFDENIRIDGGLMLIF